ncbi:MAG: TIGR04086 family membrane protein [Lachnospiraceae bacterium]
MNKSTIVPKVVGILKIMLVTYIATGILLLILSVLLYQFEIGEGLVRAGIIVTYVVSCFLGGFIAGKSRGQKKFLWGLLTGICYFLILFVGALAFQQNVSHEALKTVITAAICAGSGMAGGMIS